MTTTLITGANKGLGKETARRLIAMGHTVYLGSRDEQRGREAADELGVRFVQLDVTDDASVAAAIATIESEGGTTLSTTALDPDPDAIPSAGRFFVDYALDHFPLAPGNYIVKLVARDLGSHVELDRFVDTPLLVRSGGYVIDGMFDLRGRWSAVRNEGPVV